MRRAITMLLEIAVIVAVVPTMIQAAVVWNEGTPLVSLDSPYDGGGNPNGFGEGLQTSPAD